MNREEMNEWITRNAVMAALSAIDKAIPSARHSAGPLGDELAASLHKTIAHAIERHDTREHLPV